MRKLLLGPLLLLLPTLLQAQCTGSSPTWTSTPDRTSVNTCVTKASSGDTIHITSGSVTWSSGISVPSGIGITIVGDGTPNSSGSTTGASASCSDTTITVSGTTAFTASPNFGAPTMRLSCMAINYGGGSSKAFSILGRCTASGCPSLRVDNITFSSWAGHALAGISYGISAVGDMFGVMDHNTINGATGNYLQLTEFSHASYLGVGSYGDNAWSQPENYGSANFLFIENNLFNTAGCCENEGSAGSQANQGGGRVVVRFNTFANMDNLNFAMGWHGSESNGRPRSTRAFEFYGNTWNVTSGTPQMAGARGGTGLAWGNTLSASGGGLSSMFTLTTYRTQGAPSDPWGACDGSDPYDTNDGTIYFSGTVASGGGSTTITVSGSPGWTSNQLAPNGAPYSLHDVTQHTGTEITANGSNTLTLSYSGGPGAWLPNNGDSIQILRATVCVDQAGGRGAGLLYSGITPQSSPAHEVLSPSYFWMNSSTVSPSFGWVSSNTKRIIKNREFYTENQSQAAQTNGTSPFNGSTTIGVGHGTLANRPTTCMTGVAYWAADQGNWNTSGGGQGVLYICGASGWPTSPSYTPYTYPHPIVSGNVAVGGDPPNPPTGLQANVQ